jgi:hypothetical protein
LDERTGHQDLESDRKVLQQFQQLSALSPEERERARLERTTADRRPPTDAADPLEQAVAEVQAASKSKDLVRGTAAQERVVALLKERGQSRDVLYALTIQLVNLASFYGAADRYADAAKVLEEAVTIGESIQHNDLAKIREWLANARELAAMSPEERQRAQAEPQDESEEPDETDAQLQAQLAALPPEQRAQLEAAMRAFARMSPEEQAAAVAQAQRAQIQSLADQVRDAGIAVRRGQAPREQVLPQLEQLVAQIEKDQPQDSPWGELASFTRAVIVLLRGRASLILIPGQRAEPLPPVPAAYAGHLAAIQQSKG